MLLTIMVFVVNNWERMAWAFLWSIFPFSVIFLYLTGFENLSGIKDATPTGARKETKLIFVIFLFHIQRKMIFFELYYTP
ncbi:hypothetical protein [Flavobacterium limnosediminis]|uniref:hypothetical protein n=1 Tax=Flavobacterium limnosediminis TaxID=1401027 RepID=UPI00041ADC18|nr:hypothetical protein [Flavobacterium limnosediminis]